MNDTRLARIETVLAQILDALETHTEMLTDVADRQKALEAWLNEPPKSDLSEVLRQQRWLAEFGQADKWKICLRAARMPPIRSDNGETSTSDPQSGLQGEGGTGRHQGREDAG